MGDAFFGNGLVDGAGADVAQAHAGARHRRQGPGEGPAVAMEHRQCPQIDRMLRHGPGHGVADGADIGAAMRIDDALRIARRAAGVVQRDGVPLVVRLPPLVGRITARDKVVVGRLAQQRAGAVILRIVDIDHSYRAADLLQRAFHDRGVFPVGDEDLRFAVVQDEGDCRGVQPGVQRVEYGAGQGNAEMAFEHLRDVRQHRRHRVALADAALRQRRAQPARPRPCFGPGIAPRAVDHGRTIGKDRRRPFQQRDR